MRSLQKFLGLTPTQRRLFVRTALLVGRILIETHLFSRKFYSEKLSQRLLKYRTSFDSYDKPSTSVDKALHQYMVDVLWFVGVTARRNKRVNCLIQGYAAFTLLKRKQIASYLQIGVARPANGKMKAHAWLLVGGRVVLGDEVELREFTPIACFTSKG